MLPYRIKQARTQLGLNQSELSEKLNISRTAVVNWETGYAMPRDETITLIAVALKVEKEWLLDTSNDEFEKMELSIDSKDDSGEMTYSEKVGARLKYYRKRKGLTLEQVSQLLSIGKSSISGYEVRGREPNFELLNKFADLYEMSIDHLLGRGEKAHDNPFSIENDPWIYELLSANETKKEATRKMWEIFRDF